MNFLINTVPGLEDVVLAELAEKLPTASATSFDLEGQLRVETDHPAGLLGLDTIHDVVEIRHETDVSDLDQISTVLAALEFPEIDAAESFRITSQVVGQHPFTRLDVQRAAGAAVWKRYRTPVDLKQFEIELRVDLYRDRLVVGIPLNRRCLSKRIDRARSLRSSLKPTIAAAMLRICRAHRGPGRLIDPLCGIGTIPIEAKRINPALEVSGADWDPETVEAAAQTVGRHGLEIPIEILDARGLAADRPAEFDYIVTDPPYGVRQARRAGVSRLYRSLLPAFEAALKPNGLLALVVVKHRSFQSVLEETGLRLVHERKIRTGGLSARLLFLAGQEFTGILYARTSNDDTGDAR